MKKIVINKDGEEFFISRTALMRLRELGQREALQEQDLGLDCPSAATSHDRCGALVPRDDQKLVQVVEELGVRANGHGVRLKIVEIPNDVQWEIVKHNGIEQVTEVPRP